MISAHPTAAAASNEIDRLSREMVRTGAPSDAVELVVIDAGGQVVRRGNAQDGTEVPFQEVAALAILQLGAESIARKWGCDAEALLEALLNWKETTDALMWVLERKPAEA